MGWVSQRGRFTQDRQREEVIELFQKARKVYGRIEKKEELIIRPKPDAEPELKSEPEEPIR